MILNPNMIVSFIGDILKTNRGINIISLFLYAVLLYPLIIGFLFKTNSEALLKTIKSFFSTVALLLSLMLSSTLVKNVFMLDKYNIMDNLNKKLTPTLSVLIEQKPQFLFGMLVLVFFLIIYQIVKMILHFFSDIALAPLLQALDNVIKKGGNFFRRVFGLIFQIPKAFCYLIIITFLLNYVAMFNLSKELDYTLENSKIYNLVTEKVVIPISRSEVAKNLPNIINDSFKIYDPSKGNIDFNNIGKADIIYYNGVTLEEGVKSNDEINSTAVSIAAKYDNTYDKAKAIYKWVGSKITYDNNKAVEVMNNSREVKSGAIVTFNTRKGVCFDYACLFVAMCRANDIKVRLVIGDGFNGKNWVSHSWNEVYLESENRWINVDPTFYVGGNYYDSERFVLDHKNRKLAGEW